MAHVAKYTRAEAGHLCKHHERAVDENGEYLRFGNQDIDLSRTKENYNLSPVRDGGLMEFIQKRCSEVKCLKRKDVNVLCSWVVTAPQLVTDHPELHRPFFNKTYEFLKDRYGEENVVSAYVHMDEITPHMHFAFVPVVADRKTGQMKVSAKERVNRTDLQSFHPDLEKHLELHFGQEIGILNGATKEGNRSIEELKRQSAADRLTEAEARISKMRAEAERQAQITAQQLQNMRTALKHGREELLAAQKQLAAYKATVTTFGEIDSMGKGSMLGNKITFSPEEADNLKSQAKAYWFAKADAKKYKDDADRLRQWYSNLEKVDRETVPQLRQEIRQLKVDLKESNRKLNKALTVINSDPELAAAFDRQLAAINQQQMDRQQKLDAYHEYDMER